MKIFGRTPGEYLRLAAIPLAVLAVFAAIRVDLYRHGWLPDGAVLFAYQATLLFFIVRVRLTRFGNFATLLPLFVLAMAVIGIVDGASLLVGRQAPDNLLVSRGETAPVGLLLMALTVFMHWVLGSIILALTMSWARVALTGLFAFLFFAALVPQLGAGIPLAVMAGGALAFLVKLIWRKSPAVSARLRYSGSVFLVAFMATFVGVQVSCQLQNGDEATAQQLVTAIESYHQKRGQYPESLQALVPDPLPALPLKFGQYQCPYYYERRENSFQLSYSTGFKMGRTYQSANKQWESYD